MKRFIGLLLTLVWACSQKADDASVYRLTADFNENEKILVIFMERPPIIELITNLSHYEQLGVIVASLNDVSNAESTLSAQGATMEKIEFFVIPNLDIWIRDNGPAIVRNRNGELRAVDFRSNIIQFENNDRDVASYLNVPLVRSKLRGVGGERESNGHGTVIMLEAAYKGKLNDRRKKVIAEELKEICGITRVVWLKNGLVEDEVFTNGPLYQNIYPVGAGGHIDEFCRFIDSNTVLLAEVPDEDEYKHPVYKANHDRLEENYTILDELKDEGYKVIRIPVADMEHDTFIDPATGLEYQTLIMASYLNFVIGNNVVIAAKYYEEGKALSVKNKDEKAREILQSLFPSRTILQLNPRLLNNWGGGYHCWTYNLPKGDRNKK